MKITPRRRAGAAVAATLAASLFLSPLCTPRAAADDDAPGKPQSDLGYPVFTGSTKPVPDTGVTYDATRGYLPMVYAKDLADGAGSSVDKDFWMDRMLARTGALYDDNEKKVAFTRGRALYMKVHNPAIPGWAGQTSYWETTDKGDGYVLSLYEGDNKIALTEDVARRKQTPSYYHQVFTGSGARLIVTKFITHENVMVSNVSVEDTSGANRTFRLEAASPHAWMPDGEELIASFPAKNNITMLNARFSGDGFTVADQHLERNLSVSANGSSAQVKIQLGFLADELPESEAEYEAFQDFGAAEAFTTHVRAYNKWWADNIVYLDTPEDNIDKTLFYRWWVTRYNFLDMNAPGNDYQFPTSIEGVMEYNNAIDLTIGMFINDMKYYRTPDAAYGSWLSAGETQAGSGRFRDNPGDPANWNASHTQYISEAMWHSYKLHGGPATVAERIGTYAENDTVGQMRDLDSNNNGIIDTNWNAWTGNDADATSFAWKGGTIDRAESAYVWAGAMAGAEALDLIGQSARADALRTQAERTKHAITSTLWDDSDKLLKHRITSSGELIPWKEINNYYPWSVGMMPAPGDDDYDKDYNEALRLLADADHFPVFPFYTADQVDKSAAAAVGKGGTNNFSIINSTVYFRTYAQALRDYGSEYVTPEMYKQMLYWNAFAHYQGGDNRLPNQNEFWANGTTANGGNISYRSWIPHTQLGTTNFTVIEDVVGLQARTDDKIELDPIDIGWDYFTANNLRYHGHDLTVVWDRDGSHYGGPAGYSIYVDGELGATVDALTHVVFDATTGQVELPKNDGASVVTDNAVDMDTALEAGYSAADRVVDLFRKAGVEAAQPALTNKALGKPVTASGSAGTRTANHAVDGEVAMNDWWSAKDLGHAKDWLEVDLGQTETVDDVRLYFYRTSSSSTVAGYAAPRQYQVEYFNGSSWKPVPAQTRTPQQPAGNLNHVQFPAVQARKIRVVVEHQPGLAAALKEIQVFDTGADVPGTVANAAPRVIARQDLAFNAPNQARLLATITDDALPSATLTSQWSTVSAPEDAMAVFDDASATGTVVRMTAPGQYVFRLSAGDGDLTGHADVTVVNVSAEGKANIAPKATAAAPRVTGWNRIAALNDGKAPYPAGDEANAWGVWSLSADNNGYYTATLTWSGEQRIDESAVLFHYDGGGIQDPGDWYLEYRDATGAWTRVAASSAYPIVRGQLNHVAFDAVKTTALRLNVKPSTNYIGVIEWEAYAEIPDHVDAVNVMTAPGVAPALPATVDVVYADGDRYPTPVTWAGVDEDAYAQEGQFDVLGFLDTTSLTAKAHVYVRSQADVTINGFEPIEVRTPVGAAPQLPAVATAILNNGARVDHPVAWDAIPADRYQRPGSFTVSGTVEDAAAGIRAQATVRVGEGGAAGPEISVAATTRCVAGKVVLAATATNDHDEPLDILVETPYGSKTLAGLAPGKSASAAFSSRLTTVPAGSVEASATSDDGTSEVSASFGTASCS
ncbi:MAG TPA: Ig-like domain-containing protein [Arachnia sp.]|nr:Ig-like domain-containing protein [Arachnia sp.]HMT86881.1 Ig-like domain-containing protein [Arachnia sp.]